MKQALESKERGAYRNILAVAERLFSDIGFEKTTVSDIARELQMSPANIYRFFSAKADISGAVGRRLLAATEATGDGIVKNSASAREKLRALLATIESANEERFLTNRKMHDLLETAFSHNWPVARDHIGRITELLGEIISQGNRDGEFAVGDCELAAILVRSASIRFWHPCRMVEDAQNPEPTLDDMVDFCLAALAQGAPATKLQRPPGADPTLQRDTAAAS